MLDCSTKSALNPADLTEQYVEGLREASFYDNQIVAIVLVTCLFNFMNCIASSMGVAVPRPFTCSVGPWLTGPAVEEEWLLGAGARQFGNLNWKGLGKALGGISKTTQPPSEAQASSADGDPSET